MYCRDAIQGLGSLFSGLASLSGFLATTLVASSSFQRAVKPLAYENARRREVEELKLFHDIEDRQGDSKLFYGKYKELQRRTAANKSPPMWPVTQTETL